MESKMDKYGFLFESIDFIKGIERTEEATIS